MAAIILPRKHYTQPQGRVEIIGRWGDFIQGAYLPENPGGVPGAVEIGSTRVTTARGRALSLLGDYASSDRVILPSQYAYSGQRPGVIAGVWLFPGTVDNDTFPHIWSVRDDLSTHAALLLGNAGTDYMPLAVGFTVAAGGTASVANALVPPLDPLVTIEGDGFGPSAVIYFNGQPATLSTTAPALSLPTHNIPPCIGNRSTGGRGFSSKTGAIEYVFFLRRQITQDMRESLHANPYQIFRADPHRIYSLPPVITIPTLSLPGVIDIGPTSARPQVTLTY